MNVGRTKKPDARIDVAYLSRFHIQTYGRDNRYPQNLIAITSASGTAELCLARYAKFVEGFGFVSELASETTINHEGETLDDLLHAIVLDLTRFGGFAVHVNYNALGEVASLHHIPFEQVRLSEKDDRGYVSSVKIHPDWQGGKMTKNGKTLTLSEREIREFPIFNPAVEVVQKQIMNSGGIEHYGGQVLWLSTSGKDTYPTPIYDAAITDISTDEGLGNIKYRNVRNNFLVACMLITKKRVPEFQEEYNDPMHRDRGNRETRMISDEDLLQFQGDERGSKILNVELEDMEDEPKVVEFPVKNFDKDFTATESSVIERIYAQFHQEPFYMIRLGKTGFSGTVIRDSYEYYAGEVTNEQRFIKRGLESVMHVWHDAAIRDIDLTIEPLKYISSEDNNNVE